MTVACLARGLHGSCHDNGDDEDDDNCYNSYPPIGLPAMWVPARKPKPTWDATVSSSSLRGQRKEKKGERERGARGIRFVVFLPRRLRQKWMPDEVGAVVQPVLLTPTEQRWFGTNKTETIGA